MPKNLVPYDAAKIKAFLLKFQGYTYDQIAADAEIKGHYESSTLSTYFAKGGPWNAEYIKWAADRKEDIEGQINDMLTAQSVAAMQVMINVMVGAGSDDKDKLRAAENVLDRAGFVPVNKVKVDDNSEDTAETMMQVLEEFKSKNEKKKQKAR